VSRGQERWPVCAAKAKKADRRTSQHELFGDRLRLLYGASWVSTRRSPALPADCQDHASRSGRRAWARAGEEHYLFGLVRAALDPRRALNSTDLRPRIGAQRFSSIILPGSGRHVHQRSRRQSQCHPRPSQQAMAAVAEPVPRSLPQPSWDRRQKRGRNRQMRCDPSTTC
jgi:hypothetical protein